MLQVFGGHKVAFFVVSIRKPDRLILVKKIATHLRPLGLELKAVVICVVTNSDVLVPCDRVSNMMIELVLLLATGQMSSLDRSVADNDWGSVPFANAEVVLGLGNVDVGWNIVRERVIGRSDGHGEV